MQLPIQRSGTVVPGGYWAVGKDGGNAVEGCNVTVGGVIAGGNAAVCSGAVAGNDAEVGGGAPGAANRKFGLAKSTSG